MKEPIFNHPPIITKGEMICRKFAQISPAAAIAVTQWVYYGRGDYEDLEAVVIVLIGNLQPMHRMIAFLSLPVYVERALEHRRAHLN